MSKFTKRYINKFLYSPLTLKVIDEIELLTNYDVINKFKNRKCDLNIYATCFIHSKAENSRIELYPLFRKESEEVRLFILLHEFAHILLEKRNYSESLINLEFSCDDLASDIARQIKQPAKNPSGRKVTSKVAFNSRLYYEFIKLCV